MTKKNNIHKGERTLLFRCLTQTDINEKLKAPGGHSLVVCLHNSNHRNWKFRN